MTGGISYLGQDTRTVSLNSFRETHKHVPLSGLISPVYLVEKVAEGPIKVRCL